VSVEDDADRALFMDAAVFGTAATWTPAGGDPVAVSGIWSDPHRVGAPGDGPGVSTTAPSLTLFATDLPAGAAEGDEVSAKSATWTALDLEPDGSGLVRVTLQRA
jgi:hypothetical protein